VLYVPGAMSLPTAYVPSWSMVVFGADPAAVAGADDGVPGADVGEGADAVAVVGDGAGDGVGDGVGSAPAALPDTAQPARTSPAAANRVAADADVNLIGHQSTGTRGPFSHNA